MAGVGEAIHLAAARCHRGLITKYVAPPNGNLNFKFPFFLLLVVLPSHSPYVTLLRSGETRGGGGRHNWLGANAPGKFVSSVPRKRGGGDEIRGSGGRNQVCYLCQRRRLPVLFLLRFHYCAPLPRLASDERGQAITIRHFQLENVAFFGSPAHACSPRDV